jgi:hypothetical protein
MPLSFFRLAFASFILISFERTRELRVFHALMRKINEKSEVSSWLTLTFVGYPQLTSAS